MLSCEGGATAQAAPYPEPTWFCVRADGTKHGAFVTLFPDRSIAARGSYEEGKLGGAWKRFHPNGAVAVEGGYVGGLPDGTWRQYAPDGTLLGEYTLARGTGTLRRWYDAGPLYSEIALKSGVPHGALTIYAPDGQVVVRRRMWNGKLDGKHVVGSKNMLRVEETFYRGVRRGPRKIWQYRALLVDETYDNRGRLDGPFAIWRDRRTPAVQGTYAHDKRTGNWVWTDRHGEREREGSFASGKKIGTWREWTHGKLTFQGTFRDGKPDGEFIYYNRAGAELGRFTMADGTGTMLTFHANKKPSSRTRMRDGLLHGRYEVLTTRGKPLIEGHYANDRKHGRWRAWTRAGELLHDVHYARGKLDGSFKKYSAGTLSTEAAYRAGVAEGAYAEYRDGKPVLTGQFAGGKRTGTWTAYDASGAPTLVATYKDGVLDGPWRQVTASGTREGRLSSGRPIGTWTQTDRSGATQRTEHAMPPTNGARP